MELRLQRIAELAQRDKIFSGRFRLIGDWWNRHQTQDRQSRKREQRFHFFAQFLRGESELTPLACDVDLKQHSRMQSFLFRDSVDVLRKLDRIDAVNHFEQRQRMTNFVFLKMTNEVPAQV